MSSHVLETVERVCDRMAIIKSLGQLLWEGDIRSLARDQPIDFGGRNPIRSKPSFCTSVASTTRASAGFDLLRCT